MLKAITEHANAVLKPGTHSNGDPKDLESISVVDKLAIELFQARSEYEDSTEALRLEKEAKKRMNKSVSNLLAPPPTSLVQLRESMAVGSCSMLSCLSRTPPLSESGTEETSVVDVDEASSGCAKKQRKTSGCLGSADAFYTLSALVCQEDKAETAIQGYFEEKRKAEQRRAYFELSQLYKSGDITLEKFEELKPKDF